MSLAHSPSCSAKFQPHSFSFLKHVNLFLFRTFTLIFPLSWPLFSPTWLIPRSQLICHRCKGAHTDQAILCLLPSDWVHIMQLSIFLFIVTLSETRTHFPCVLSVFPLEYKQHEGGCIFGTRVLAHSRCSVLFLGRINGLVIYPFPWAVSSFK